MAVGDARYFCVSIREGMAKGQDSARRHMGQARRVPANWSAGGRRRQSGNDAVPRRGMVLAAPLVARVIDFPSGPIAGRRGNAGRLMRTPLLYVRRIPFGSG